MAEVYPLERGRPSASKRSREDSSPKARSGWWWVLWAWDQTLGNPTQKAVLLALAKHADADGVCWPSVARIRRLTDLKSDRAVQNSLRALEARGLVVTDERRGTSSLYQLTPAPDAPPHDMHPAGDAVYLRSECTPPPQEVHLTPAGDPPKLPRTPNENQKETVCAADAANRGFSEFFERYPRPGNREATQEAYEAALAGGAAHSDLMAALKRYCDENKENIEGGKRQYLKYSDSWLTERYFERYQGRLLNQPVDRDAILEQRAKAIRECQPWVSRHYSAACARELVDLGKVTAEQCKVAGFNL